MVGGGVLLCAFANFEAWGFGGFGGPARDRLLPLSYITMQAAQPPGAGAQAHGAQAAGTCWAGDEAIRGHAPTSEAHAGVVACACPRGGLGVGKRECEHFDIQYSGVSEHFKYFVCGIVFGNLKHLRIWNVYNVFGLFMHV